MGRRIKVKTVAEKKERAQRRSSKQEITRIKRVFTAELRRKATLAELKFLDILEENKIEYCFQKDIQCGKKFFIVDFYLPEYQCVVEIDGGYHFTPEQDSKDRARTKKLLRKKMVRNVIRFTNDEVDDQQRVLRKLAIGVCPFSVALS
jgi:very-short-patch-repair endonuclease